jgi:hypothetical protein
MAKLTSYSMSFDGELLQRGFWLYVWEIRTGTERHLYVGRTGDSSSPNAASPFQRIGQHLDSRENAKGNSLARQMKTVAVAPSSCAFEMIALGPLFPEQKTFDAHKPVRDRVGALEAALAQRLLERGYSVIGSHSSKHNPEPEFWQEICRIVDNKFPAVRKSARGPTRTQPRPKNSP